MRQGQAAAPRRLSSIDFRHPLTEPTLFYDPPYASALEDRLAWQLVKYLDPAAALHNQAVVLTPDDCFRVDFLVERETPAGTQRVGILIDTGAEDAAGEPAIDDALLVGSGAVDVLFRFREEDLDHRLHDALLLAAKWEPDLFTRRGRVNLHTLASPEARDRQVRPAEALVRLSYEPVLVEVKPGQIPERPSQPAELVVQRLSHRYPAAWLRDYDRALARYDAARRRWPKRA